MDTPDSEFTALEAAIDRLFAEFSAAKDKIAFYGPIRPRRSAAPNAVRRYVPPPGRQGVPKRCYRKLH